MKQATAINTIAPRIRGRVTEKDEGRASPPRRRGFCPKYAERGAAAKPQITIGIGIASGEMVAGYTGTNARATYTCIGNTVNRAARLEAHTKVAGRAILIDDATRLGLSGLVPSEPLGTAAFKGITEPVEIFAVSLR